MLQIAICDDDPKELSIFSTLMQEYIKTEELFADVLEFSRSDILLSVCENRRFHLYILDIVMPLIDGISLGKAIRRTDKEAQIIYVTTGADFALQSFAVNPVNFLVKPVEKQAFFDTLTLAISKIELDDRTITVRTKEAIHTVALKEILYCEYRDRGVAYILLGKTILHSLSSKQSFSKQIAPLLQDAEFLQPHISFAINLHYVEKFTREEFILKGGIAVPISKKQYSTVRSNYLDYCLKRETY